MPHFISRKRLQFLFSFLVLLLLSFVAHGQVTVAGGSGAGSLCVGGGYVNISNVTIQENAITDISIPTGVAQTINLVPTSADFEFEPNVGSFTISSGTEFVVISGTVTAGQISITLFSPDDPDLELNTITISGLRMRAISLPGANQFIERSSGTPGTCAINGFSAGDDISPSALLFAYQPPTSTITSGSGNVCGLVQTVTAVLTTGTGGTWSQVAGPGVITFAVPAALTTTATASVYGNYVVKWEEDNNGCKNSSTISINYFQNPTADAGADKIICAGAGVTIGGAPTATGGDGTYTYLWTGGSTLANPVVSPAVTTVYNLTVTDGKGCVDNTQSVTVTVNTIPATPSITSPVGPIVQCQGAGTITLTSSASPAGYQWYLNGAALIGQTASTLPITEIPANTGIYTVTVLDVGPTFCESAQSAPLSVIFNPLPSAAPVVSPATAQICTGSTTALTVNGSVAGTNYQVFDAGLPVSGIVAGTGGPIVLTTGALFSTVSLTVKASFPSSGCIITLGTGTVVTVNPLPTANAGGPYSVCSGLTTTLNGSGSGGTGPYTFSWSPAVGLSSTIISNPVFSGLTTTTYSLIVTDSKGCISSANNATVTVNPLPLANAGADVSVCFGSTTTLNGSATLGDGVYSYSWAPAAGLSATNIFNPVFSGAATTTYTLTVTDGKGCVSNDGVVITVNPLPVADAGLSHSICFGASTTLGGTPTATGGNGSYSYLWTGGSTSSNPVVSPAVTTTYNLIVTDGNGCVDNTQSITITVNPLPTPTLSASATSICAGTSVTFTGAPGVGPAITNYDFQVNGITQQSSASPTYITSTLTNGQVVTVIATTGSVPACPVTSAGITMTVNSLPTPTLSASATSICAGSSVTFTAGPGAGPAITNYDFQVDGITQQSSVTNTYITSTLTNGQVVTVIATTGSVPACPVTSAGITMTVNSLPTPTLSASATSICAGTSVTFTGAPGVGPAITNYDFQVNGITQQSSASPTYITSTLTNGQVVTVIATTGSVPACPVTSAGITMTVNSLPTPTLSASATSICAGSSVTFTAGPGAGPAITNYDFQVDGITQQSSVTNTYITSTLTNGQVVTVIATTGSVPACPVTSAGITMTVNSLPTPTLSASATSICAGTSVTFTGAPGVGPAITNYDFQVNGITQQSSASPTYITSTLTNGQVVTVIATTGSVPACPVTSAGITMTVNSLPTPTLSASATSICAGSSVTFTAGPGAGPAITNYDFQVDGITQQSSVTNTYITSTLTNGQVVTVIATTGSVPACPVTSAGITMTVNSLPTPTLSASATSICAGTSVTFTGAPGVGPAITNYDFQVNGITQQSSASPTYITSTLTNGQVVTVIATTGSVPACPVTSAGITMTVNSLPTPTLSASATSICAGSSVTFTAGPGAGPAITNYDFQVDGITQQSSVTNTYITSTLTNGQVVTVIATTGSVPACPVTSAGITMTVNSLPTPTLSASATSICAGTSVTFTGAPGVGPAITNYDFQVNGITQQSSASPTYITSTLTNGQVVTVIATTGSVPACPVTSAGITMTVNSLPTPTLSASATSICAGSSVTFTAGPGAGPAITNYDFQVDGITQQSSVTNTYITSTLTNGQVVTVIATTGSVPACPVTSAGITMTVNSLPTPTLSASATSICAGTSVTFTGAPGVGPAITNYDFQVNGITQQSSASPTYITSTLTNGQVVTVIATTGSVPACPVTSAGITMTVNSLPTPTLSASATSICAGSSVTFTAGPGAGPAITNYDFQVDGITQQSSVTNTYITSTLTNGQVVTVIATTGSVPACPVTSAGITMTVNSLPTPTLSASATSICAGTSVTFTGAPGVGPAITNYDFQVNGITQQSSASPTYITSTLTNGQVVTVIATTGSVPACPVTSAGITMTVNSLPTPTLSASATSICAGSSVTFTAGPGAGPAITNYDFQVDGITQQSSVTNTYITSTLTNGQVVTVIATTGSVPACPVTSAGITMTVNSLPTPTLSASATSICAGTSVTFTGAPGVGPAITNYDFQVNGITQQSSASPTYITSTLTNGQVVTVIATTGSVPACPVTSAGITMTVNSLPTPTLSASATSICAGSSVTFTAGPGAGPAITNYDFQVDGITQQSSVTNTYITSTLTNGQVVTVIATTGSVPACPVTSAGITMTVNSLPTPTLSASATSICAGTSVTFTGAPGVGPAITNYDFQVNGITQQSSASPTYITSTLTNGQVVTVIATTGSVPACPVTSAGITMTVNSLPTPTLSASATSICAGSSVTFTAGPGAGPAITNYDFQVDGITQQSSVTNTYITSTLTNGQVVTVIATTGSVPACPVTSAGITMTVNSLPTPTLSASATSICAGTSVTFTGAPGVGPAITNYDFQVNGITQQSSASPTYITSTLTNGQVVTVIATTGSVPACPVTSAGITMTVNSLPTPTLSASATSICAGSSVTFTAGPGAGPAITNYDFQVDGITQQSSVTNTYITSTLTNGQVVTVIATTGSVPACPVTSAGITMTVNSLPTPTLSASATSICAGTSVTFTGAPGVGPAITNYDFQVNGITQQSSASPTYITSTLTNGQVVTVIATTGSVPACPVTSAGITMTVNPIPVITTLQTKTICSGANVNYRVTLSPGGFPTGTTYSWSAPTMSAGAGQGSAGVAVPESNVLTITDLLTNTVVGSQITATYKITPTSSSGCVGVQTDVVIFIDPAPVIPTGQVKTICSGANINYKVVLLPAGLPVGTTYSWPAPTMSAGSPQGSPGVAVPETNAFTLTDILTNTSGSSLTATYVITPTTGGCAGAPVNVVITVNPAPVITSGQTKTICSGANVNYKVTLTPGGAPAGTTYSWPLPTMSAGGAQGTSGAAVPEASALTITDALTNTSGVPITATYVITPTSGGCVGTPVNVVITIDSAPVIAAGQNKIICSGSNANYKVTLTPGGSPAGTTYSWSAPTMSAGAGQGSAGIAVPESNVLTITDLLTNTVVGSQITATYKITPTSSSGCVGVQTDVVIFIDPAPVIPTGQVKTICSGANINYKVVLLPAGLPVGTTYSWPAPTMSAGSPQGSPGVAVPETNAFTLTDILTNTSGSSLTATYAITPTTGGCAGAPVNVVITVNPAPVITSGQTKTICSGANVNYKVTLTPGGAPAGTTYSWPLPTMSAGGAQGTSGAAVPEASALTITDALTNTSGVPITATYVITPTSGGCVGTPVNVVITIDSAPVIAAGQNKIICSGSNANYKVTLTPGGSPAGTTYSWSAPTMSAGAGQGSAGIAVPESNVLTITDLLTNTVVGSQITATYKITPTSSSGCVGVQTDVVIFIDPAPVIPTGQVKTICSGANINYKVVLLPAGLPVGTTYSWPAPTMSAGSPQGSPGVAVPETNAFTLTDILTNTSGSSLTATYAITPTTGGCAGAPVNVVITVNPAPVITSGQTKTICSGANVNYKVTLTPGGAPAGTTYSWPLPTMSAGGAQGTSGAAVPEASALTITDALTNTSGVPITATYVITPTSGGCVGTPVNVVITIDSAPVIAAGQNKIICSGSNANYKVTLTPGGSPAGTTYSWSAPTMSAGAGQGSAGVAVPESNVLTITDLLTNTVVGSQITATYKITPTSSSGCVGVQTDVVIFIDPAPVIPTGQVKTICSGANINYKVVLLPAGLPVGTTYSWPAPTMSAGSPQGSPGVAVPETNAFTLTDILTNTSGSSLTATYVITPTTGGCAGAPVNVVITVNPAPVITSGQTKTICSGANVNYKVTLTPGGAPAGTTYSWPLPTMSAGGAQGTSGAAVPEASALTITDALTNTSGVPITATYVITPTSGGCVGTPINVVITVDPSPVVTAGQVKTICSNTQVDFRITLTPGGFPAGTRFSWPVPTMSAGGPQGTAGVLVPESNSLTITDLLLNTTSLPITATYNITPTSASGCVAALPVPVVITINPEPVGTNSATTICSDLGVGYNLQTNVNSANAIPSNFAWIAASNTNVNGESLLTRNGNVIDDILMNTTNAPQVVSYSVRPSSQSTGCLGNTFTINVTVNPKAQITAGPDLALCANFPGIPLQGAITYAPNGVVWSGGAGSYSNSASATSTYTFVNPAEINQTLTLTLTANDPDGPGPCPLVTDQMTLKINPLPVVVFFGLPAVMAENNSPIILSGNQVGGLFTISPITSNIGSTFQSPTDQVSFDPSAATLGLNTITYTYTNANSCTSSDSHNVIVNPVSVVDFSLQYQTGPLAGQFVPPNGIGQFEVCANVGFLKIVGNPLATTGIAPTFFAPSNPNSAVLATYFSQVGPDFFIDTNGLPSGDYAVTYTYTNSLGATSSPFTRAIKVFAGPTAAILPPTNNCIVSAITLTDNSTMPPPVANPFGGVIVGYNWNFGDGNFGVGSSTSHTYSAPAIYNVVLDITTNQGCKDQATLSLRVGPQPVVDFNWSAICTNDLTKFLDQTNPGISTIITYTWDFGDGSPLLIGPPAGVAPDGGTNKDPFHNYVVTGTYPAKLTVDTNDGCTNSLTKNVFILTGGVTVKPDLTSPYYNDFEPTSPYYVPLTPGNGWIAEGLALPPPAAPGTFSPISWIFGTPAGNNINSAASSANAWWTGAIVNNAPNFTYYDLESSVMNGPCFDLTLLKRPMISLDYWSDAEKNLDGTVVQYSTDGGLNWSIVGPLAGLTGLQRDQGINWYDPNATIVSNPGRQLIGQYGWTDKSGGWKNARFNLDMVPPAARAQVRVRVAFSSNDKNAAGASYDGFAFDNVYVGEKQRNVLVEHFTNSSLAASVTGDAWVNQRYQDQITNRGTSDFYDIQYHINFPNFDQLNIDNPGDPAGRALYFGVSQSPSTIMDGILDGVKFKGNYTDLDALGVEVDRRALKDPLFDLKLTATSTGTDTKINVTLDITARQAFTSPLIAQVALLDNQVVNGVGTFQNVLRRQLLGPDGETITIPFAGPPTPTTVTRVHNSIDVNVPISNPAQLTLVAFVQDKNTKEIYQSIVIPAPVVQGVVVTGVENPGMPTTLNGISIYPNPAKGSFNFGLPDNQASEGFAWKLIDQRGINVRSGDFGDKVNGSVQVDVSGLANGIYIVVLSGPGGSVVHRKIVVMN